MAEGLGLHHSQVARIWKAHRLKPHRVRYQGLHGSEVRGEAPGRGGLYVAPPERAIVFSFDEKSQIQALDRTQPGLPLKKGRAGTMTHDYKRHGTTTLFAALDVATGEVIHECLPRHRHQEFLRFLRSVEKQSDPELELHFILDNYATHKQPKVKAWLEKNPRVHFHFLPTSASWLWPYKQEVGGSNPSSPTSALRLVIVNPRRPGAARGRREAPERRLADRRWSP
jgi:transposase